LNDANRDTKQRFNDSVRLTESSFLAEFPLNDRAPLGDCLPSQKVCPFLHELPDLPVLKNFFNITTPGHYDFEFPVSKLIWTQQLEETFGPTASSLRATNTSDYFNSPTCGGGERRREGGGGGQSFAANYSTSKGNEEYHCHHSHGSGIIISMADGYDCNHVALFLKTLRDAGSCAEVVIIRTDIVNRPCWEIEDGCGGVVFESANLLFPRVIKEIQRDLIALRYLNQRIMLQHSLCTQVLLADFRDIFFQKDPFQSFPSTFTEKVGAEVIITEESFDDAKKQINIGSEPTKSNLWWFQDTSWQLLGKDISKLVFDMPVLNSGQIYGTLEGVHKLLHVMAFATDLMDVAVGYSQYTHTQYGPNTQGILTFCYYSGMLSQVAKVKVMSPTASFFANTVYHTPKLLKQQEKYDFLTNPFVNAF
jgi:hypothetical protein